VASGLGDLPPKMRSKKWASFEKRWNFQLRRLYQGSDFTHLAPVLLQAAEDALQQNRDPLHDSGLLPEGFLGAFQPSDSKCSQIG
jgi:hypothetical protein